MLRLFSEREKVIIPKNLKPDAMPMELRNRLWNATDKYINKTPYKYYGTIIEILWDRFFKQDLDSLQRRWLSPHHSVYDIYQIKENFYSLTWNGVYDFLEFLIEATSSLSPFFIEDLNSIFEDEKAPYKIIDNKITPLISKIEVEEVGKAINHKYGDVNKHLKNALELYCKRPKADYKNSIKESISAIEALARTISKAPHSTLGELVKNKKLNIHPGLKNGISALYGWTSNEGGIRHAEKGEEFNTGEEEARFMLVQCSALVNYIISKFISD